MTVEEKPFDEWFCHRFLIRNLWKPLFYGDYRVRCMLSVQNVYCIRTHSVCVLPWFLIPRVEFTRREHRWDAPMLPVLTDSCFRINKQFWIEQWETGSEYASVCWRLAFLIRTKSLLHKKSVFKLQQICKLCNTTITAIKTMMTFRDKEQITTKLTISYQIMEQISDFYYLGNNVG